LVGMTAGSHVLKYRTHLADCASDQLTRGAAKVARNMFDCCPVDLIWVAVGLTEWVRA
jgi:hypothetical protein